jgi:L-alanine-DL-glutamate epimerase-like enolase superfamily enzyme
MRDPDPLAAELERLVAQGFRAFKLGWGPFGRVNPSVDEEIVRRARETVGADVALMVDAGGSDAFWPNGYRWALRTAAMLAEHGVDWFEEPLAPDALDDYTLLREHSPVPIAAGEVLTRRQSFLPWLQGHALDIVQPDVTKVGGLSEARRIAWTALDNGVAVVPHGWNTALGLAADLQLASALPGTDLVEYLTGSPYIDAIVAEPWRLDADGMLAIPDRPGLGVALDHDRVAHYARGERLPIPR